MFYTIQTATRALVEGDAERPPWLNASVHLYNAAAAWGDLLTAHRTFSARSERVSSALVFAYVCYIQLCRHMNGQYPYPFLRNLRQPHGFVGTLAAGLTLFAGAFRVGKALNRRVRAVSLSIAAAGDGDTIEIVAAKAAARGKRGGGGGGGREASSSGGGSAETAATVAGAAAGVRSHALARRAGGRRKASSGSNSSSSGSSSE